MIIDTKLPVNQPPPPPYAAVATTPPPSGDKPRPTLITLPPHILLEIVYSTFPQKPSIDHGKIERQRKTLLWLVHSLRFVNRSFYIACMHVLRSTYLPAYQSLIRQPYSSDPFPTTTANARSPTYTPTSASTSIHTLQRETVILDRFIALKVREDVLVDDSELHLEREDLFKDLFDHAQPKARLEDLVRKYGFREGVISIPGLTAAAAAQPSGNATRGDDSTKVSPAQSTSSLTLALPLSPLSPGPVSPTQPQSPASRFLGMFSRSTKPRPGSMIPTPYHSPTSHTPPPAQVQITPIPFSRISISLSPRTIGFVVGSGANKRTLVQVQRYGKDENLETGAKALVNELKDFLLAEACEPRN
ncbi:hypothetical protein P691DRAFT_700184 [Macrolepiota fuliginosa MF-IS2]|uniref:Uncharacterized protein n=1 Tax=Macrolepiota fuliginosa MF-IS2 TaxID=1400762 RepID=A0A9P5XHE5_9AGAR|nr:hypothetical protein P691DRAFT_700184 [Macrolepiota fuliginosa MF-IS2]